MADKPIISFVSGSYNRRKFIEATLNSIRNNGITVPYEIIIIDGGSIDGTMEYLVKQTDVTTIVQHNREIINGKSVKKHGWGYFMNTAFKMAKGKYIMMLSDDTVLVPNAVMNGYNLFEKELNAGRKIGGVAFYFRNFPNEREYHIVTTLQATIAISFGLFLRDALADAGWIEEDLYKFYYADYDLCLKIHQQGYEIIESPNSYVEHTVYEATDIRKSNLTDGDRNNYLNRWRGIFYNDGDQIHRKITKEFTDPAKTYKTVLRLSPKSLAVYFALKVAPNLTQEDIKKRLSVIRKSK